MLHRSGPKMSSHGWGREPLVPRNACGTDVQEDAAAVVEPCSGSADFISIRFARFPSAIVEAPGFRSLAHRAMIFRGTVPANARRRWNKPRQGAFLFCDAGPESGASLVCGLT